MVPRLKNTKFHTPVIVFGNIINEGHVMPQNSSQKDYESILLIKLMSWVLLLGHGSIEKKIEGTTFFKKTAQATQT